MSANAITVRYFEARIFPLSMGLISKSLMVPQLNSEATIPAAIMIVNSPSELNQIRCITDKAPQGIVFIWWNFMIHSVFVNGNIPF